MNDLVTIASYGTVVEAELARERLRQEDIPAEIDGAAMADMAGFIGTALGGVRLLVRAEDAVRASELLEEAASASITPAWDCPACGAEVDAGYEVCWSCGTSHPEVLPDAAPPPAPPERPSGRESESLDSTDTEPFPLGAEVGTEVEPCPECAEDIPVGSEKCPACGVGLAESSADAVLKRAWWSAVLGIFILQGFLHVYSLYQLYRYVGLCDAEGRVADGRAWVALGIDLLAVFAILFILRSAL